MTGPDKAFRDEVAVRVMSICMADTSRQMAEGRMPLQDASKAAEFIATFSYAMADQMLKARKAK